MSTEELGFAVGVGLFTVLFALWLIRLQRLKTLRDAVAYRTGEDLGLNLPPSLHPVIDTDICMGSLSCIKACPEGDILGIVDGAAALISGANCIGHGRCAIECPVDAIKLVFGTSERGIDLPEVGTFYESSRPGVHIVGELGGMGLIRNALRQGLEVARRLGEALKSPPRPVVIVGAGPAGLATAAGLRATGIPFRLLEQNKFGGTVASFPRHKIVMTEPVRLPGFGKFGRATMSKDQLLGSLKAVANKLRLEVEEGVRVETIDGADDHFRVHTTAGSIDACKVVLATGRRGNPRKLGVPGEELDKVTYQLMEPEQYKGSRVLVVGGGDSALEAAMALADKGAQVTLSYRNSALGRCRPANKSRFEAMVASGRLAALMSSQVEAITERDVALSVSTETQRLANDYVMVCIGGELPLAFLQKVGVEVKRHHGTDAMPSPVGAKSARQDSGRWLVPSLWIAGICIIAVLAWVGRDYYLLSRTARLRSPLHTALKPSGIWGHGVGIVATLFMMSNFLYAVRKRWRLLKGAAPIRRWLTVHMFVGIMSPLVIVFHAAFQSNNLLATITFAALIVVVSTGIIGRFIYGLVPRVGDKVVELGSLQGQWERERQPLRSRLQGFAANPAAKRLLARIDAPPPVGGSLFGLLLLAPARALHLRLDLWAMRRLLRDNRSAGEVRAELLALLRLRNQIQFNKSLRRFFSGWRIFHVTLSVLLVLTIAVHIGISLYLGYGWILL